MITIGLTGGYATGKTKTAGMFLKLGAEVIYADRIAHKFMRPYSPVWKNIVKNFGKEILSAGNKINRKRLGDIVFCDWKLLKKLNRLVHPSVKVELRRIIRDKKKKGRTKIFILEIPLLFEAGIRDWFDKIVVIRCSQNIQYKRACSRDNIKKNDFLIRLKSQWPLNKKERLADFVVDNSGKLSETKKQVYKIWKELKREDVA